MGDDKLQAIVANFSTTHNRSSMAATVPHRAMACFMAHASAISACGTFAPQCLSGGMERSTCLAGRLVSGISHHPDAISRQTLYYIHLVRAFRRTSKGLGPSFRTTTAWLTRISRISLSFATTATTATTAASSSFRPSPCSMQVSLPFATPRLLVPNILERGF